MADAALYRGPPPPFKLARPRAEDLNGSVGQVEDGDLASSDGQPQTHHRPARALSPTPHLSTPPSIKRFKAEDEEVRYQFWPKTMEMGSLVGRKFHQMHELDCHVGMDKSRAERFDYRQGEGFSYLRFNFEREFLKVKASFFDSERNLPPAMRPLDFELPFGDIACHGLHISQRAIPQRALFWSRDRHFMSEQRYRVEVSVTCSRPPKYYMDFNATDEEKQDDWEKVQRRRKMPGRRRATAVDFDSRLDLCEMKLGPLATIQPGSMAYPTLWNAFRMTFELSRNQLDLLESCASRLRGLAETDPDFDLLPLPDNALWYTHKMNPSLLQTFTQLSPKVMEGLPFSTRASVEGLLARGVIKPSDVGVLLQALRANAVVPAFQDRILGSMFNEGRVWSVERVVRKRATILRQGDLPLLDHLVLIRSVVVTPTRVLVSQPMQESSNSVTRRYADRLEGLIRVQFADEEDKLFVSDYYTKLADEVRPNVGMIARVRRALRFGIIVGGRRFLPVASSPSQQKDHSIWFIDPKVIDGSELRAWMGSVDETIVAKHAARMGLPFSTSRGVNLHIVLGVELADVKRNGFCFTDGVAVAGSEVMREAARAMGVTSGVNASPSAIQSRLGGAKGVLACWPDMVTDAHEVRLRPSLVKFQSNLRDLNVVRLAKYQPAYLNRQFVNIMCANGVPEDLLFQVFSGAVGNVRGLRDRVAQGLHAITKDDHRLLQSNFEFPLRSLIKAGFNRDPLVLDIVAIIECKALQDLKWRARVRLDQGVFLMGVADESGTLREGEVFCQFQDAGDSHPTIVQSEVLICRAPALHPGDVRRVSAVDRPELHHLKNVIVFSTQGERDLPNMLGGGDLDGDDYTLIWDQRFVQPLKDYPPMDYTGPEPVRVPQVTQAHLNENFVQYMLNDVLGSVANAHLARSDHDSPFSEECLNLCQVHSTAVDFAKTGVAAEFGPDLRPKEWPDFMDRYGNRRIYESTTVLGRLFRLVQPDPHFMPCDIREMGYPADPRIARFEIYDELLERLRPIKAQYEDALTYDMRRYRVWEPEIPSGLVTRNKRRKGIRDSSLNEPLRDSYEIHVGRVRQAARQAIEGHSCPTDLTDMQLLARHCYALVYEREQVEGWARWRRGIAVPSGTSVAGDEQDDEEDFHARPMISFAWAFWHELVELVTLAV